MNDQLSNVPEEDDEEKEICWREYDLRRDEWEAEQKAEWKRRTVHAIGYGNLYDDWDGCDDRGWTIPAYYLGMDILFPGMISAYQDYRDRTDRTDWRRHPYDDIDDSSLAILNDMVEHTVKQWLMDFAPKGTKTGLVWVALHDD